MRRVIRINASKVAVARWYKEANLMEVSVGLVPLTLWEVGQDGKSCFEK
jgi:hypothetical protein